MIHLIDQLVDARRGLLEAAEAVPPERRDKAFLGRWDVKDLLAHFVGWDYTNIEAVPEFLAGRLPAFYGKYDRDWATYNASLVRRYGTGDWQPLLDTIRESQRAVVDVLRALPEEELDRDRGLRWRGYRMTIAALFKAALADEREHLRQLRDFAASP